MVGPSLSDTERAAASQRLRYGFVVLVGCSGGLVALSAGATLVQTLAAVFVGLLVGWALLVYLGRVGKEWRRKR